MISDNHRPLLQYAERDPAEEQWCRDAEDQPTKYQYLSMLSPEPQFAQKLNDPHQQDSNRYLENAKLSGVRSQKIKLSRKLNGVSRKFTF
jgi:hypothetical protein